MATFREVVLIVVSFTSLGIALYCLLFMLPAKRFWRRMRSLGGGLKGIESHVSGVRDEVAGRLAELEESTRQQLAESRQTAEKGLERIARENREAQRELEKMRKHLQSLQAELRETGADTMKVARSVESLTRELQQLRSDFEALDPELRASVRQLVADSFSTVESTVLSALEAVQEEMLYGVSERTGPTRPRREPPRPSPAERPDAGPGPRAGAVRRSREKIITVEPLFPGLRRDEEQEEGQDEPDLTAREGDEGTENSGEKPD